MRRRFLRPVLLITLGVLATSCIDIGTPTRARTFRPVVPADSSRGRAGDVPLHLVRVIASAHLGQSMAWRLSDVELSIDAESQWAAPVAELAEQALLEALFLEGPYRYSESRDAPELRVDVQAFEGERSEEAGPQAVVTFVCELHGRGAAVGRFTAQAPLEEVSATALARGVGGAMDEVCKALAAWLDERLETPPETD